MLYTVSCVTLAQTPLRHSISAVADPGRGMSRTLSWTGAATEVESEVVWQARTMRRRVGGDRRCQGFFASRALSSCDELEWSALEEVVKSLTNPCDARYDRPRQRMQDGRGRGRGLDIIDLSCANSRVSRFWREPGQRTCFELLGRCLDTSLCHPLQSRNTGPLLSRHSAQRLNQLKSLTSLGV